MPLSVFCLGRPLTRGHARQQAFSQAHTRSCSPTAANLIIGVAGLRPAGQGRADWGLKAPRLTAQPRPHNHMTTAPHAWRPASGTSDTEDPDGTSNVRGTTRVLRASWRPHCRWLSRIDTYSRAVNKIRTQSIQQHGARP